ncbi:MAG: 16S rRNA (adenine(1518)-N(6)/adenine(1519)-N(6))-dimethyltransferase RsmA [Lachnospiraceae bacterium]|nr:16S rRNA (adenine(1518)-N(6)/adenine(1519)-N(6))-dimethyltransferase RsmA [Lachnospiraceae bacterium]
MTSIIGRAGQSIRSEKYEKMIERFTQMGNLLDGDGSRPVPYLGNRSRCKAVLEKYGFSFRKKFGQNFLIDESVLLGIIDTAGITKDDYVLEIGPGIGTLTQYLATYAGKVCAVEIDRALLPILEDTLAGWDNVTVLNADILKTDIRAIAERENGGRPLKVCANLPYYITTPILMGLFESGAPFSELTVMVQKEVAERMIAEPGSKAYGALSLAVRYFTEPKIAFIVDPGSFMPRPKVQSAVVHMKRHASPPVDVKDEQMLFDVIRASFNERRKTLQNGIADYGLFSYSKEQAGLALDACGLDRRVRGEKLALADFARLADVLVDMR